MALDHAAAVHRLGDRCHVVLDVFEQDVLDGLSASNIQRLSEPPCLPKDLESLVLVRGAAAGPSIVGLTDSKEFSDRIDAIKDAARLSLGCNPYSSISWIMLAWANMFQDERDPTKILGYIDMSYVTGPREFVTLVRRIELWLQLWADLDTAQKARLGDQINLLARDEQYSVMALFYLSASPDAQAYLLERFSDLDRAGQNAVARIVRSEDGEISLPLVEPEGERPWR